MIETHLIGNSCDEKRIKGRLNHIMESYLKTYTKRTNIVTTTSNYIHSATNQHKSKD